MADLKNGGLRNGGISSQQGGETLDQVLCQIASTTQITIATTR